MRHARQAMEMRLRLQLCARAEATEATSSDAEGWAVSSMGSMEDGVDGEGGWTDGQTDTDSVEIETRLITDDDTPKV